MLGQVCSKCPGPAAERDTSPTSTRKTLGRNLTPETRSWRTLSILGNPPTSDNVRKVHHFICPFYGQRSKTVAVFRSANNGTEPVYTLGSNKGHGTGRNQTSFRNTSIARYTRAHDHFSYVTLYTIGQNVTIAWKSIFTSKGGPWARRQGYNPKYYWSVPSPFVSGPTRAAAARSGKGVKKEFPGKSKKQFGQGK